MKLGAETEIIMAISEDVLVIGGGLSGGAAALAAAETGVSVRLVSHKESTLRHASGLIDVLGYLPDGTGPIPDPFDALADVPDEHPYSIVGETAVREGLALFDEIAGDEYVGDHTDTNALVPTHGGSFKPTARYPRSMSAGLASDNRNVLFVGFESLPDFDAPLAAEHLAATGVPFETSGVTIPFPGDFRDDAKITRLARALDRDENVGSGGSGDRTEKDNGGSTRQVLADAVAPHLATAERVGFPALLGDNQRDTVRDELESRLGVPVFEVPGGPPSLPGLRLEDLLFEALDEADVRMTTGVPVVGYETETESKSKDKADRIASVLVDRNGQQIPYHAEQFVLATGGLVGKGIDTDRTDVREPIFDCYVPHSDDRYDWFLNDTFDDHPFARFGVVPDDELRPVDASGAVECENLRAAGSVLGGANIAAEKSGSGISLATGFFAGRNAGEKI
jgi:glycerol-3-phosphate dehydrogenase subunit B